MGRRNGPEEGTGGEGFLGAGSGLGDSPASPGSMLAPGREFDLIRSFLAGAAPERADVRVGPGDDATVVRGDGIVLTTDLSIEETHFRRDWLAPFEIGYRAAMAALSDLAGMAARPIGLLASLAVSESDAGRMAVEIMKGVTAAVAEVGGVVLGGDLTASPGPIVLDIVGVGEAAAPALRSGAAPGDEIWVTGSLGGAALAVDLLLHGGDPPEQALERYRRPRARTREALWLAERKLVRAMLDLSDGLGGDAAHLAAASGVAVVIESAALPIDSAVADSVDEALATRLALSGGEDYEICFAAAAGTVQPHAAEFERELGCRLTLVGRAEAGEGVHLMSAAGERARVGEGGFQHFRSP